MNTTRLCLFSILLIIQNQKATTTYAAFIPLQQHQNNRIPTCIHAKSKIKKGKKGGFGSSSSGFGTKSKKPPPNNDKITDNDFLVFPALEKEVLATLVPSTDVGFSGALPDEMYDRLAQIYGFHRFNFKESPQESSSEESSSENVDTFADLFSSDPEPEGTLADLLTAPTTTKDPTTPKTTLHNQFSNLPPFQNFRVLHIDPMVLAIDDFFTPEECDRYISLASNNKDSMMTRSKTVGKDALAKAQRTSTTWFHDFKNVPELVVKGSRLLGLDGIGCWEEPQTVRYRKSEKFTWHLDALAPTPDLPKLGGQRIATLLVYLTDLSEDDGGATTFRDLGSDSAPLKMRPKKGSALLFFPSAGGVPNAPIDIRTLHAGETVAESASTDKWIAQMWLRETSYTPTAPPGNTHDGAKDAMEQFCKEQGGV